MMTLRVFKLTSEAEIRGIDWSNFDEVDIETVQEIEVDAPDGDADMDEIMADNGYVDFDIYGGAWI